MYKPFLGGTPGEFCYGIARGILDTGIRYVFTDDIFMETFGEIFEIIWKTISWFIYQEIIRSFYR